MSSFYDLRRQIIRNEYGKLNDMQFKAVCTTTGPLLVLAGAGSGKTTVIINRIANIIKYGNAYNTDRAWRTVTNDDLANMQAYLDGNRTVLPLIQDILSYDEVKPWRILAITFTNKAANELRERLAVMLGDETASSIWAATFHSCCVRILRKYGDRLGFSSHFTIYDTDDSKRVIKECQRLLGIDDKFLSHKMIINSISRAKDSLISPEAFEAESGSDIRLQKIAAVYKKYQELLKNADAMDFDDIIVNTVELFRRNSDVLQYYNDKFTHVMVDEYQDTNHAQFVLTRLLAGSRQNICVVGDDDQSIYKFRGATIENILNFEEHYPSAETIRLEENYRSTQNILDAANAVIANNKERKGKALWTSQGAGDKITLYTAADETVEAEYVVNEIIDSSSKGRSWSDYAILYRMNAQSNNLERSLVRAGVPYRIIGGHRFYERKEIRDAVAYLSVVVNPKDEVRMRRIINEPKRGIGETTINNAMQIAAGLGISFFEVISNASAYPPLSRGAAKLMAFADMISELNEQLDVLSPQELFNEILNKTDYISALAADPTKYADRVENINELSANIVRFTAENPSAGLVDFLEEVALLSDIDNYNADSDSVVLMTLHSAKGLEFPVCFIVGMENGVFPGMQSLYNETELEEERRLAYVGITRAKQKLYLTNAATRMMFGSTQRNSRSVYVQEIPSHLVEDKSKSLGSSYSSYGAYGKGSSYYSAKQSYSSASSQKASPQRLGFGAEYFTQTEKQKAPSVGFKTGDAVMHKKFGKGVIIKSEPMGNDILLEVAFEETGTKRLMAKAARLEII